MAKTISEITHVYLEGKTLQEFADALGCDVSKQSVHQWKTGNRIPNALTLLSVLASPKASGWAKAWAGECLAALQQAGKSIEDNLDKEIERRR